MRPEEAGQIVGPSKELAGAGGSATAPEVLAEGGDPAAAPQEPAGAGRSSTMPEVLVEGGGFAAMPQEPTRVGGSAATLEGCQWRVVAPPPCPEMQGR